MGFRREKKVWTVLYTHLAYLETVLLLYPKVFIRSRNVFHALYSLGMEAVFM